MQKEEGNERVKTKELLFY